MLDEDKCGEEENLGELIPLYAKGGDAANLWR